MRKTSVYLSDSDRERLAWLANREGTSQAEILRKAIAQYVVTAADRDFVGAGSFDGPGDSIADVAEDLLRESFGE